MEGHWAFSRRAFSWRSRDRSPKEKENKQMYGSFRKSFGKSWRFKRSNDNAASSLDSSDCATSDSQRRSFSASKPPCQSFGSTQSQVYPQDNVSSLNKPGLLYSSAQLHGERRIVADERRRLSDVGVWTETNDKFGEVPNGMYKRLHMLSRSDRHPEVDYTFSNINFHKASKDSIKDDLQMHDICLLEESTKADCTELQKHDTTVIKVPKDSGNTEASHNVHLANKHCDWKSLVSHPEASSQAVIKDGKDIAYNSSGKSGNIKSSQKFLKSSKHFLLSHSADEARSRAIALQRWFKHIIKRKGSQNLKSGEREQYHLDDLGQSMCMNAELENDILQQRIIEDRGHSSSGLHSMVSSLFRKSKANKAYLDGPDSLSQLLRSSSLPHTESYHVCQNIHADMPRRSEASAGNLRRFSVIGSEELEVLESDEVLFPRRRHRESIHKKSVFPDNPATVPVHDMAKSVVNKFDSGAENIGYLNNFLRRQRTKLSNVSPGDDSGRVKIILSGSDLSLSSMMAAIGYAWLLEYSATQQVWNPVPVINTTRQKMWEHREAAWLFYHCGLDARTLLFCDEVDLESLVHARQLSIMVIGQDALKTEDEVASLCTILVEEYKEHAYELLRLPYIRKILLAGILLDTQNLDSTAVYFTTRDRVAVDLLLVGCSQYYRYSLFDELNQSHSDSSFEEAMRDIYGEPPSNSAVGKGDEEDEEDECQNLRTDSKDMMASSETDVAVALQHEDGSSCLNANLFDDPVFHPETSLAKSDVSQLSSLSLSGRNSKINWMVAKWFGFGSGSGSRQSVET